MNRGNRAVKKAFALLLSLVMVVCMMPSMAFAAEDDMAAGAEGRPAAQLEAEGQSEMRTVTLNARNIPKLKVYAEEDTAHTEDYLQDVTPGNSNWEVRLAPGNYVLEAYGDDGTFYGAIDLVVTDESEQTYVVCWISQVYARNDTSWEWGRDYTADLLVSSNNGIDRHAVFGWNSAKYINQRGSFLCYSGDTAKVTLTPDKDLHPDYSSLTLSKTFMMAGSLNGTLPKSLSCSFTVPSQNQTVQVGTLSSYYIYKDMEPIDVVHNEDGTVTYMYSAAEKTNYYCRVSSSDDTAVTYWTWVTPTETAKDYTITEADLKPAAAVNGSKTLIRDFSQSQYDVASMLMTVNAKGYINLDPKESYTLNCFRSWQTVENSSSSTNTAEPDYHYTVINADGTPSDVVSVTPDPKNSGEATVTANKNGTAIVLVTYDAVYNKNGGAKGWSGLFSASWPENTGVFVVSVGKDGTAIRTNMTLNEGKSAVGQKLSGDVIDSELDVLYYYGSEGASYSFTPESGVTSVEVLRPVLTESALTYNGWSTEGVVRNKGAYTVTGLTKGKNIIKVTKNGVSTYQVLTVKSLSYKRYSDQACTHEVTDKPLIPGETTYFKFDTVYIPANKLAGIYNMAASIVLTDESGRKYEGTNSQYDFSSKASCQTVAVTVPDDAQGQITLSGNLYEGGWGNPYGDHRNTSYAKGKNPNFTAKQYSAYMGDLGKITVPVAAPESISVTTPPARTSYNIGDSFDPAGMVVTANYNGGTSVEITDYDFPAEAFDSAGDKTVTIRYQQGSVVKTADVQVIVSDAVLENIEITSPPAKTEYWDYECFDPSGMEVTAHYSDGSQTAVTQYTVLPKQLSDSDGEVQIIYGDKSAAVNVHIKKKELNEITVTKAPDQTVYAVGDVFNPTGMEITAAYNDGTKQVVTGRVTFRDTVFTQSGTADVIAAYEENGVTKTTRQPVTVKDKTNIDKNQITVRFTLLGDDVHGEPAGGEDTHTLKDHNLKTWVTETEITLPAGSTVNDVVVKALGAAGIPFENPSGNYITSVRDLAEFTNGSLSGWMYTLNGTHPVLGVSEQVVRDGDVIVFHYTDDYTREEGSDKWSVPADPTVTKDIPASIKGDSAEASVSASDLAALADAAAEKGADKVQLNITGADKADKVSVELPKTAVSNIANQTDADLTVTTPLGNVTLDKAAMNAAVKAASGSDITIVLEKQEIAGANKEILGSGAVQTKVSILSGGKEITDLGVAKTKILLPVADELKDQALAAASVAADGKLTKAEGQTVTVDGKTYYQIETSKPGSFVVAETASVDAVIKAQGETDAEKLARIKKGVQNTTITITGTSKGKGWIKVNWKKSKGYKVDYYEVFRKTGKSGKFGTTAFYKTKKHGITGWYKNTKSLKKGNRYYYKVRGVRILDGKKVYTKWSKTVYRIAK